MVVGAGRGPLVDAVLRASERSGRPVRLYAVEKNPNAVVTYARRAAATGTAFVGAKRGPCESYCALTAQAAKPRHRRLGRRRHRHLVGHAQVEPAGKGPPRANAGGRRWRRRLINKPLAIRGQYDAAQADILVSELLGSFGDNELSPECLDGALRLLKGASQRRPGALARRASSWAGGLRSL